MVLTSKHGDQPVMAAVKRYEGAIGFYPRHYAFHDIADRIAHMLTSVFIIPHLYVFCGIIPDFRGKTQNMVLNDFI